MDNEHIIDTLLLKSKYYCDVGKAIQITYESL
jgi:hypothetical protein